MLTIALALASYLLGAVPFGLLIGCARGVDVRQHGSGNIGATNVGRVLGRPWGLLCLALDVLKGFVPTFAASFLLARPPIDAWALVQWIFIAAAAVLGHTFPVYLQFRGGKGVATTIGVALGIYPYFAVPMIASLLVYAVLRYATGIVSVGSLSLALTFPLAVWGYMRYASLPGDRFWPLPAVAALLGLLIVVRHHANIARLFRGQETGPTEPTSG
ncbi:MAG: glycerol-3-phosphate 1-O-acyltransferase PlsY [Phycisphaerae bacterium]